MKNTIKILVTALTVAAAASSFTGDANAKMSKKDMMSMVPMMCMMAPGKEAAGRGPMCVTNADAKVMMAKKHPKMHEMMCEPPHGMEAAGRAGYGLTCVSVSKFHMMMKHG
ncbi:MAG: hypothetical protein ABIN69_02650 [Aestuariivirga sp.]